ncbi:MAG: polyprenol monophosphomannose synthase [Candidatus Erginobacter occultus]|nr:polyprenol monophosphomannose synthase [Candidatus Erginobacter occultus]
MNTQNHKQHRENSPAQNFAPNRFVVIATYNENANISQLISEILSLSPSFQVLVVDDNSPDGTGRTVSQLAQENQRVHLLPRPGKRGYGTAIIDGFRQALDLGADRIFTMDADYSHNPRDLLHLDQALDNFDIVIGSRYRGGIRILNWSISRLLLSLTANCYARILFRFKYADCTSGFRAYRHRSVKELVKRRTASRGYGFLVEVLYLAEHNGDLIGEVPIIYTERRAGESKISQMTIWEAVILPWKIQAKKIYAAFRPNQLQ